MMFLWIKTFELVKKKHPLNILAISTLIFYEQNNFQPMKEIFIGQFEFSVKSYF
jgi:hypothetical protein